jgi:hypothetical protein
LKASNASKDNNNPSKASNNALKDNSNPSKGKNNVLKVSQNFANRGYNNLMDKQP